MYAIWYANFLQYIYANASQLSRLKFQGLATLIISIFLIKLRLLLLIPPSLSSSSPDLPVPTLFDLFMLHIILIFLILLILPTDRTGWGRALQLGQTCEVAAWESAHLGSCNLIGKIQPHPSQLNHLILDLHSSSSSFSNLILLILPTSFSTYNPHFPHSPTSSFSSYPPHP